MMMQMQVHRPSSRAAVAARNRNNLLEARRPEVVNQAVAIADLAAELEQNDLAIERIRIQKQLGKAPEGNECILYFSRDLTLFDLSSPGLHSNFKGHLIGDLELISWDLFLDMQPEKEYFNLKIVDNPSRSRSGIWKFQQVELLMQFFRVNDDKSTTTLIHEEPTHRASLENRSAEEQSKRQQPHCILFENILPVKKLEGGLEGVKVQPYISMRIYVKLMKGGVNVQHGLQKCFHPDSAIFDLQEKMRNLLVEGANSDIVIIAKDGKGYKAHRSIMAANSDFYQAMFKSDMKEAKENEVKFDFNGYVLEAFLKFIYARNRIDLELNPALTTKVWLAADMYAVTLLKSACEETLLSMPIEKFSLDDALLLFHHGTTMGSLCLQTKAVKIIMRLGGKFNESKFYKEMMASAGEIVMKLTEMIVQFSVDPNSAAN